jgi:hypothetical protein
VVGVECGLLDWVLRFVFVSTEANVFCFPKCNCRGVDCGTEKFPSVGSRTSASTFIKDKTCELSSDPPSILCTDRPLPDTPTPSTISPTSGPTVGPAVGPTVGPTVDERTIVVPLGGGADLDLTANETAVPTDEVTDDMMADP